MCQRRHCRPKQGREPQTATCTAVTAGMARWILLVTRLSRSAAPQARRLGLGGPRGRGGFGGRVGGSRLLAVSLISGIGRRHVRQVQGEPYQHQQVPPSHHPEHQKYRIHVCRCISRNVFKKGLRTEEWVPKKQQKNKKHPYDYWTRGNGIAEWRTIECPVGHGRA